MSENPTYPVVIILQPQSDPLIRFAAEELRRYLKNLFDVTADIIDTPFTDPISSGAVQLYIGPCQENPYFNLHGLPESQKSVTDQAVILHFVSDGQMVIAGGSPAATLWAVYALVAEWGVVFLLHQDVLPPKRTFFLPQIDRCEEPIETIRTWSFPFGLAFGPESWGLADYAPVINQLAKLRFNRLYIQFYPDFPYVDLEFGSIHRSTAGLFFNCHFPITDDMVGRELFDDRAEFWNRDLPISTDCQEMLAAGQKLVQGVIDLAHSRGMLFIMGVLPLEYPKEFAPAIKNPLFVKLLQTETVVPGPEVPVEDPDLFALSLASIRSVLKHYPTIDILAPVLPEFRDWVRYAETAWQSLDKKYRLDEISTYEEILNKAAGRTDYPGGGTRAVQEVKGDIVALYYYDLFFCERNALSQTAKPKIRLMFMYFAEELYPILTRVLPKDTEITCYIDYTPTRILKRREVLKHIDPQTPYTLCYTLHDDNIGFLPMVAAESLGELLQSARKACWRGLASRYWLTSDHDICVNYLARSMWDASHSNFAAYARILPTICGEKSVYPLLGMFRELENATAILERDGLGFAFPVPEMVSRHWERTEPDGMTEVRLDYERALDWARQAREHSSANGMWFVDYWINRIAFGINYLRMTEAVYLGGRAWACGDHDLARMELERALQYAHEAGSSYVKAARNRSDVASIAIFNEYGIRYLRNKINEISIQEDRMALESQKQ